MGRDSWKEVSKAGLHSGWVFVTIAGKIALLPVPIARASTPPVVSL